MALFVTLFSRVLDWLEVQIQQGKIDREEMCAPESLLFVSLELLQQREIVHFPRTKTDSTDFYEKVFTYEDEGYLDQL